MVLTVMSLQKWFCTVCLLVIGVGFAAVTRAEVTVASLFTDGAVLQRAQPMVIWGWAAVGERVAVEFAGRTETAVADGAGNWRVILPSLPAATQGRELRISGSNAIIVRDVLVGDVWICSGQSNMEMTVKNSLDATHEIAGANFPDIRQIKIERQLSERPLDKVAASGWNAATPEHVGWFTAAGYYFARDLYQETGVPIGLINCTWSGTSIEPWMSAEALATNPAFAVVWQRWRADLAAYPERRIQYEARLAEWLTAERQASTGSELAQAEFIKAHRKPLPPAGAPDQPYPGNPTQIFNGMVHPLRHAAVRGVLWYQGEANAVRASEYSALFQATIRGWRMLFGAPELPFYWVQIANYEVNTDWPGLREAQGSALSLPATGMAVTIDIGDAFNIHPANKQEVGRRLALIALTCLEHRDVEFSGPRYAKAEFATGAMRVSFTHAAGLNARSGPVMSLELAGEDRVFHPAEGRIEGEILMVRAAAVPSPVAVRYAWSASPRANLYNVTGLPAAPFRSDHW